MKKLLIVLLLVVLVAGFVVAESYEFNGDIWTFRDTVEDGPYIASFWMHDLDNSEWNSIDPEEWGLVSTVVGIGKDMTTGDIQLLFLYKTTVEYHIPYYIIGVKEGDSTILGGQYSNGDFSNSELDEEDGFFYSGITINLTPENIEYLSGDLYFEINESHNAYGIYFGIPEEIFDVSFNILGLR